MTHPAGAITSLFDLENIVMLGLPIEVWDIDMNTIRTEHPVGFEARQKGLLLRYQSGILPVYVRWLNIEDPTYDSMAVMGDMSDTQLNSFQYGQYAFNHREEADTARAEYRKLKNPHRKPLI